MGVLSGDAERRAGRSGRAGRDSVPAGTRARYRMTPLNRDRQHLIFDADDTLWENNIYFEEAFDEFCDYLNHSTLTPDEIRGILDEIEIVNARIHGYGAVNFGRNLSQCYLRLAERAVDEHDLKRVTAFAHEILSREIELMEGVAETLPFLAEKHELTMCTKGESAEQNRKIDLSGLRRFVRALRSGEREEPRRLRAAGAGARLRS